MTHNKPLATRRKCWTKGCVEYFTPRSAVTVYCDDCIDRAVDKALDVTSQDNTHPDRDPEAFLRPLMVEERIQVQIANAKLIAERVRFHGLLGRLHGYLSSIATPGIFPTDARKLAQCALDTWDRDYGDLIPDLGEVYRREG